MKRILMRAHMSPLEEKAGKADILTFNKIGDNSGNILFSYAVSRILMTEKDTVIDVLRTRRTEPPRELVQTINENYDVLILPLANAFRRSFLDELRSMTSLIRQLKIPCIVLGVCIQTELNRDLNKNFSFDREIKEFVDAVLEKSAMLGLRGEITAATMKRLGYVPEKDFTVIGCPSMYAFGMGLPETKTPLLSVDSPISCNGKAVELSDKFHDYFRCQLEQLNNYRMVPQSLQELRMMYTGVNISKSTFLNTGLDYYPVTTDHPIFPREIGFVSASAWLDYMKGRDFSFGCRIHGNIAAILAGTPAFIIANDTRVEELARYHAIPHVTIDDLDPKKSIFDYYGESNYSLIRQKHKNNFDHYVDFLNRNGLDHIFRNDPAPSNVPLDQLLQRRKFNGVIEPYCNVSALQKVQHKVTNYISIAKYVAAEKAVQKDPVSRDTIYPWRIG